MYRYIVISYTFSYIIVSLPQKDGGEGGGAENWLKEEHIFTCFTWANIEWGHSSLEQLRGIFCTSMQPLVLWFSHIVFLKCHNISYSRFLNQRIWILSTINLKLTCFWVKAEGWKQVPGPFMILLKWQYSEIWPFLIVDIYHFWFSLMHFFKKLKHCNLYIIDYWVTGAWCYIEKDLEISPSTPNCSKDISELMPLFISINWQSLVT